MVDLAAAMSLAVEELRSLEPGAITSELARSPHLPYAAVPGLAAAFRASRLERLAARALELGGRAFHLRDERGATCGFALLERLPHETRHFARPCARLRFADAWMDDPRERERALALLFAAVLAAADRERLDALWVQARAIDYAMQQTLEAHGFRFADALVDWVARGASLALGDADDPRIRHGAEPELAMACGALAASGMRYNRFRAETRFASAQVDALYDELGQRCARGEIGAHFLCLRAADGALLGFASLDAAESVRDGAPCEMFSFRFLVRSASAPPGTGTALLEAGCRHLVQAGAEILLAQTVLQNAGMFRSALKLGFRVEDALYDWFRWRAP